MYRVSHPILFHSHSGQYIGCYLLLFRAFSDLESPLGFALMDKSINRKFDEDAALRTIVQGTSTGTGEDFFRSLVKNLAKVLNVHGAWVTEFLPGPYRLKAYAFWLGGKWIPDYEYSIKGTPCDRVMRSEELYHVTEKVIELYPDDPDLKPCGAVSYMGVPLKDVDGCMLGHLAVLDNRPMPKDPVIVNLFRIFAARAAAELQRLRAENDIRQREEKLARLVNGAMDAIIDLDSRLEISLMNPAAETILGCSANERIGTSFTEFLSQKSCEKVDELIEQIGTGDNASSALWIPGGLDLVKANDGQIKAEATLSMSSHGTQPFYSLILRNVNDRLEAERKIQKLSAENARLEEELTELRDHDEIIGRSKVIQAALLAVEQVAKTDATVLLLGETGTGKELFARAIHRMSARKQQPLVKVNCAAIPANLIESEFFGHEKGSFTGATSRREGRFALADGGTIFLDEVGELPIDLQSKLLRVLQEGEFESVGSGKTQKVNARVVAATNRDLKIEIEKGNFREDLYFRLNVFPIEIPALHERGNDILHISQRIVKHLCNKMGRPELAISELAAEKLCNYRWPGNVRELQNVLERSLIMSRPGHLDLEGSMPFNDKLAIDSSPKKDITNTEEAVLTADQLQELERANILRALNQCAWTISGEKGAAVKLGLKPSTLSSRMKALGIERPR